MRRLAARIEIDPGEAPETAREARMSAVRLVRAARNSGIPRVEVARDLGVLPRTLLAWERRWRVDRLEARRRGRPRCRELSRTQRQAALWALRETGGHLGVGGLMQVVWPPAARSALRELKERWRYAAHRRGGRLCGRLEWTRPGSVWAMDWTDPDAPLESRYTKILFVRDLASGLVVLSLPCEREQGEVVARELWTLIRRHGAPAVVKEDNGKSLRCAEVQMVLRYAGILNLPSPPRFPGYNGACEAGIHSLKVRAHHVAAASGREEEWSCDDIESARRAINARVRRNGLSAEDLWRSRRPFGRRERERLWMRYREHQAQEQAARGIEPRTQLERREQDSVDRAAIARALEEEGLVRFRRRWVSPPIRGRKVSRER
jgi:hypothetical protein